MSEFSDKKFSGENYANARPNYPPQLYEKLKKVFLSNKNVAKVEDPVLLDLGCGPGTATFQLQEAEFLNNAKTNYIGVDPSLKMIEAAEKQSQAFGSKNIEFKLGSEVDFDGVISENNIVTVITAVQCCHWFNFPIFLDNAYKILSKTKGNLFLFGYINTKILGLPQLDNIIDNLDKGFETGFGAYWDQPGRDYLSNLLTDDFFMNSLEKSDFKNVEVSRYVIDPNRDPLITLDNDNIVDKPYYYLYKKTTVKHFREYISTWSAYNRCKREKGDVFADQLIDNAFEKCFQMVSGLNYESEITLAWSTYVISAVAK
ncbi:hypothetical protein QEN19_001780 [Hanseniaspora menglaensis]